MYFNVFVIYKRNKKDVSCNKQKSKARRTHTNLMEYDLSRSHGVAIANVVNEAS